MELLRETALVCWNAVPATAASHVPQGHSHPGVPVQSPHGSLFLLPSWCSTEETNPERSFALLAVLLTARKTKFVPTHANDWLNLQHRSQRAGFFPCFGKEVIPAASPPPPAKVSSPRYSLIKEISSKAEKLNKAVKPHFCTAITQKTKFLCVNRLSKSQKAHLFITTSKSFHTLLNNLRALREQTTGNFALKRWSPKGTGGWGKNFTPWKIYILWTVIRAVGIVALSAHWPKEKKGKEFI